MRLSLVSTVVLATLLSAACEQAVEPLPERSLPGVLEVSIDTATLLPGESITPQVSIVDELGEPMDMSTIEWTSSAPSVVAVDSLGRMTALAPGVAVVRAHAEPLEHAIDIRVPDVRGITLIPASDSLLVGERVTFQFVLDTDMPFNPRLDRFSWSTDSRSVGRIFAPGVMRARGVGDVVVHASLGGAVGTATLRVFDLGTPYSAIAATVNSSCTLRDPGQVYCWGSSSMLGLPHDAMGGLLAYETLPLPHEPEGIRFDTLVSNEHAYCALTAGRMYCWGWNTRGQFGPGALTQLYRLPVQVETELRFESITLGTGHACGLDADGRAYCWGLNSAGQLGDGSLTSRSTPAPVAGDHRFAKLDAGGDNTCGLTSEGVLLCWGDDSEGSVRGGDTPCAAFHGGPCAVVPVVVTDVPAFVELSVGGSVGLDQVTCGVTADGALWCWGSSMGEPHRMDTRAYTRVAVGPDHGCALTRHGAAYCFGSSAHYKLGNPTVGERYVREPVPVFGDTRFSSLALGLVHTCGITTDERIAYCWGLNQQGQLGLGHRDPTDRPHRVGLP